MAYRTLDRLTPEFRKKVKLWLTDNPQIFVTESWRSYARQLWLYAAGRSRAGRVVTWTLKSKHMLGEAVDIAFHGTELYPSDWAKWRTLADSAKQYGINWSYDVFGKEKAHFEDNGKSLSLYIMSTIPPWARETVEDAEKAEIFTDLHTKVGDLELWHLLAILRKFIIYFIGKLK